MGLIKMKTVTLIALLCACAAMSAQAANITLSGSVPDVNWADANWNPKQVPGSSDNVTLSMNTGSGWLKVDSAVVVNRIVMNNYSNLLVSGDGASLTTTSNDFMLNNYSQLRVENGASLNINGGYFCKVDTNAGLTIDNATLSGMFWDSAYSVNILNGSTWNVNATIKRLGEGSIYIQDSTVNLAENFQMEAPSSLVFTLDNSVFGGTSSARKNVDFTSTVEILNGSTVQYLEHLNINKGSGAAFGRAEVTVRGASAEKLSSINIKNIWFNSNSGGASKLILDGYADVDVNSMGANNSSGGNFELVFANSNNDFYVADNSSFGYNSTNAIYSNWKFYNEEGTTNNKVTINGDLNLRISNAAGNKATMAIDWSGEGNTFSHTRNAVYMKGSNGAGGSSHMYMRVRDGAVMSLKTVNIGGNDTNQTSRSGLTELIAKDGGILSTDRININNSAYADSTSVAKFVVDNATITNQSGNMINGIVYIGGIQGNKQDSNSVSVLGGTAVFEVINGSSVTLRQGIDLITSNSAESTSVSKLLVDSSKLVTMGEIRAAHLFVGNAFAGGSAVIQVTGENAVLEASNKGFYTGYGLDITGGSVEVLMDGSNNRMSFANLSANTGEKFYMFGSGSGIQTAGTFDAKITGHSNTFEAQGIEIGKTGSTGGKNTFYIKSDSADSSQMNKITLYGDSLSIHASTDASSTIENSFVMAGNTQVTRSSFRTINVSVGNDSNTAGGSASFIVRGSGNSFNGEHLRIGSSSMTGGTALARFEGYGNTIRFNNTLELNGGSVSETGELASGRLEFALDNSGADLGEAILDVGKVAIFNGVLQVDFSSLSGEYNNTEFLLISAGQDWSDIFNTWAEKNLEEFVLRDESDQAELLYRDGDLLVKYSSTVPEPAAFAAIFGLCALALALRGRGRN